jgi:hypothetical protein
MKPSRLKRDGFIVFSLKRALVILSTSLCHSLVRHTFIELLLKRKRHLVLSISISYLSKSPAIAERANFAFLILFISGLIE